MLLKKLLATLLLLALAFTALPGGQQAAVAESKYYIDVDVTNQYVTVYRKSDNAIVRQMICSTGASGSSTPLGTFVMPNKRYSNERTEWYHTLGVYVKYASRIYQGILFHSVPFSSRNEATLQQDAFNKLGSPASHGCIRLRVDDSKWIADNCPPGTVVRIFRSNSRNEIVRGVLLEVGSYSIDSGVPYNQFIGLSDDPDTLDRASSGPEVRDLQMLLQSLGFFTGTPDGTYNTLTVQAVAAFQEAAGLEATGLADLGTRDLAASPDAPTGTRTTFSVGMSGRAVEKLQAALSALKLYDGPIDGKYSEAVAEAVRYLQGVEFLMVNGEADQVLQEAALAQAGALAERFGAGGDYQLLALEEDTLMARVANTDALWMRSAPSTAADTINRLEKGTQLLVLAQEGDWTHVRLGQQAGYCMSIYLDVFTGKATTLHYGQGFFPDGDLLKRVQQHMIDLGYMEGVATGVYDRETIEAVKAFQQAIGQYPDGLPGEETLARAEADDAPTGTRVALSLGDSGRPVEDLQKALAALRLYDGETDGVYDADVAQAVSRFEGYYGYAQDGIAEPDILKDVRARADVLAQRFGEGDYALIVVEQRSRIATVTADSLWLRKEPSINAGTLDKLLKGEQLAAVADLGLWTQVTADGQDGYVMSEFIAIEEHVEHELFYDIGLIADADVKALQEAMIALGYLAGEASGVYDTATIAAVKAFETALGDEYADGMANQGVLDAALAEGAPVNTGMTLTPGSSATRAVKALQESLRALGFYTGELDGNFTEDLGRAIWMYQRVNTGSADGIADKETQEAIHAAAQAVRDEYGDDYSILLTEETVQTAIVTAEKLWLRKAPSTSAETHCRLPKGTELAVLEELDGWVRVQYGDLDGYVMAGFVTLHQELLVKPVYGKDLLGGAGAVRELQANLISLGYLDGTATGIYDLATIGAVKAFQQAIGEEATGEATEATLEASRQEDAPTGTRVTLSLGDSGKAVRALQEALQALKFYDGGLDGVYDEDVAAAVELFQRFYRAEGFLANGEAAPEVQQAALEKAANGDAGYNGEELPVLVLKAEVAGTGSLWLRADGSTAAAALAKMYRGERMTVLEKGDTWSKVQYKGQMGYAMSQYLRFYEEEAWCGEAVEGLAAVVNADALALYDEASTTAAAIMTVGRGEHVTVLMQDAAWSQVVYGGRTGYVPNSSLAFYAVVQPGDVLEPVTTATVDAGSLWLRTSGEGTAPTIASMPRGQVVDVLEKGGSWSKVVFDGMVGYSMNEFLIFADEGPEEPQEPITTATVNADSLWLREYGSTTAPTKAKMSRGDKVDVLERGETWSKVVFNGMTGYSMNEFLIFADEEPEGPEGPEEPQEPITTATVNADSLWLREYGSTTAPTKAKMSRGDKVDVLEKGETWSKVVFNGITGYSMNEFLIFADEEPEEPQEPITTATVNADSLWLREYGSSTAPTKAKMSRGDKVDVLEKGETWSKVIFNGMTGYSMNEFLIFADEEPEGPEGPEEPQEPITTATVNADSLWLREYGSSTAPTKAKLFRGDKVDVLEKGGTWCKVSFRGLVGYSMTEFLDF